MARKYRAIICMNITRISIWICIGILPQVWNVVILHEKKCGIPNELQAISFKEQYIIEEIAVVIQKIKCTIVSCQTINILTFPLSRVMHFP